MLALFYTLSEGVVGIGTPLAPQLVTSTWAAISNPDLVRSNCCTCISLTNCNSGNCVSNCHILVLYTTILDIVMVPQLICLSSQYCLHTYVGAFPIAKGVCAVAWPCLSSA